MTARATRAGEDDVRASAARDRRVAWIAAVAAWIVVAAVAGKAARDAILLASFDVTHLPPRNIPSLRQLNADWTRAAAIQRTSHSS